MDPVRANALRAYQRDDKRRGNKLMAEFLNMNGYGFYIWGAYGATGLIFFALFCLTFFKAQKLKNEHKLFERK